MKLSLKPVAAFAVYLSALLSMAEAQDKTPSPAAPASTCSRDSAMKIIQRQIDLSKTIDDDVKRISVMLRAADLAWFTNQNEAAKANQAVARQPVKDARHG